jgi:hypothetical protein
MKSIRDAFDKVGVTPEGLYCLDCGQTFSNSTWSRHFRMAHPELTFNKQYKFDQKIKARKDSARAEEDRSKYARVPLSIKKKCFCLGCAKAFSDYNNYYRHCKDSKGTATPCASATKQILQCYELVDGRFYPVKPPPILAPTRTNKSPTDVLNRARTVATAPIPRTANVLPIRPSTNPPPSRLNLFLFSALGRLPINNTIGPEKTELVLSKFVEVGDTMQGWVNIFHKRVSTTPNFEKVIRSDIAKMDYIVLYEKDVGFRKMMDAFDRLEANALSIIQGIPGNWSVQTGELVIRQRTVSGTQRIEFGRLVAYLRGSSCNIVHHYLQLMARQDLTVEGAHATGLVPKMIFELATLEEESGDSVSWLLKYLQARCFTIEHGELRFMDPGRVSSQMSTLTYIIRLSLTTILNMMQHSGHPSQAFVESTINLVQKGPVINTISKWVIICRHNKKRRLDTTS